MKAIGGYFGLDEGNGNTPLPNGVLLNSARNALRHIVRQLKIKQIHIPRYICPVVEDALRAESCAIEHYDLNDAFLPAKDFSKQDIVLYVNYFGVSGKRVEILAEQYPNVIVDCAQAYYALPKGRASLSSPRKFFGIPDGGVAYGVENATYMCDDSSMRMGHLIERKAHGATPKGYALFQAAEHSLEGVPICEMSDETKCMLSHVDMLTAATIRERNFAYLHEHLHSSFPFAMAEDDVPMVYPLLMEDASLRQRLIDNKIFVARYWPSVEEQNNFADKIIPLPIDQRYNLEDMNRICEVIKNA